MKTDHAGNARRLLSPLVMMVIIACILVAATTAWFSENRRVSAGGMQIRADSKQITVGNTVTVVRTLPSGTVMPPVIYKEDGTTNSYYVWDEAANDFVYINPPSPEQQAAEESTQGKVRIPLTVADLLPGETVEVTFTYSCSDNMEGENLKIYFDNVAADTVAEPGNPSVLHSVLGVYRLSVLRPDGTYSQDVWMSTYQKGVSDTPMTDFVLADGLTWNKVSDAPESNFKEFHFRLSVDFSEYDKLGIPTNELSEKSFTVAALKVGVSDAKK